MEKKPFTIAEALNSETSSQKTFKKADKKSAGRKTIDQKLRRDNLVVCRLNEQRNGNFEKINGFRFSKWIWYLYKKINLKRGTSFKY